MPLNSKLTFSLNPTGKKLDSFILFSYNLSKGDPKLGKFSRSTLVIEAMILLTSYLFCEQYNINLDSRPFTFSTILNPED